MLLATDNQLLNYKAAVTSCEPLNPLTFLSQLSRNFPVLHNNCDGDYNSVGTDANLGNDTYITSYLILHSKANRSRSLALVEKSSTHAPTPLRLRTHCGSQLAFVSTFLKKWCVILLTILVCDNIFFSMFY